MNRVRMYINKPHGKKYRLVRKIYGTEIKYLKDIIIHGGPFLNEDLNRTDLKPRLLKTITLDYE